MLLKNTYHTGEIDLYRLADDGSSFKSQQLGQLLASTGNEFRPLETRVGPDGALYVCDWLNSVVGHYQASYRDPKRDLSHGRIWRITANNRPPLERVPLETMSASQLLTQLGSPERAVRDHAQRLLYNLPASKVIPAADELLDHNDGKSPQSARVLYELSGVYAAQEQARPQIIDRLMASDDFRWRCWATRLIGMWADHLPDALPRLERSITDENPRVRLEAVVAASCVADADSICVALRCLEKPTDPAIRHALTQCIFSLAPRWQPALAAGKLDFNGKTDQLVTLITTAPGPEVNSVIRRAVESNKLNTATSGKLLNALADTGSSDDLRFVITQSSDPQILDRLIAAARDSGRRPSGDLGPAVEALLMNDNPSARVTGYRLASAWQITALLNRARATAKDVKLTPEERMAAIDAMASLGRGQVTGDLVALTSDSHFAIRKTALAALAPLDVTSAAERAAVLLASVSKTDEAAELLRPLLGQVNGAVALGKALSKTPPAAAAAQVALRWLATIGRDDAPLINALNAAAGITARAFPYSADLVSQYVAAAASTGDARRGQIHFRESSCLGCHKLGNEGGTLGPDLSAVGRGMTRDLIVEAVLWPKRQVKEGYLMINVATTDGRQVNGYKISENSDRLVLKDLTGGPNQTIRKPDIATRDDAGTIMPDGLCATMSDAQIADLIRFLFELGK